MMKPVSRIKADKDLQAVVEEAVGQVGGFSKYIKENETVLVKPNFNTADPFPASSDVNFVKAVCELLYEHGAGKVYAGESATMLDKTKAVMEGKKVYQLAHMDPPVHVVNFDEKEWVKKKIDRGKYLKSVSVPKLLDQVDRIVLLPCLKTHAWAEYTGALKLAVGFMHPKERVAMHFRNLQEKIADLNLVFTPDLVIMDGRKCFIDGGPSDGTLREPGWVLAGKSRVRVDIEGIRIIQSYEGNALEGVRPEEMTQIKRAMELKID